MQESVLLTRSILKSLHQLFERDDDDNDNKTDAEQNNLNR